MGNGVRWAFGPQQWSRVRGPIPTALPHCQTLIETGAQFVTRNGAPVFSVADNPEAEAFLSSVLSANKLDQRLHDMLLGLAHYGAYAAYFSVDRDNPRRPVRIAFLSVPDQCRFYFDPLDKERVLMARIQYPFRDPASGDWYLHREEWTETLQITYQPLHWGAGNSEITESLAYQETLGDSDKWQIDQMLPNPYGLIPATLLKNKTVAGNPLGLGDCWSSFRLMDRIALTMHGEDISNQKHSDPNLVTLDARLENHDPLLPGEPLELISEGEGKRADVKLLEPTGAARQYTNQNIDRWENLLWNQVGLSKIDAEAVSNKGNLTQLAFSLLYERSISTSNRKRDTLGSGLCDFFASLLLGLSRLGGTKAVAKFDEDATIACSWQPYFQSSQQDLADLVETNSKLIATHNWPVERAAREVAQAKKMPADEIEALVTELQSSVLPAAN